MRAIYLTAIFGVLASVALSGTILMLSSPHHDTAAPDHPKPSAASSPTPATKPTAAAQVAAPEPIEPSGSAASPGALTAQPMEMAKALPTPTPTATAPAPRPAAKAKKPAAQPRPATPSPSYAWPSTWPSSWPWPHDRHRPPRHRWGH